MRRRGSVTVELALVIPVVFVLLVGFIEWGWLMSREVAVIQVARDAAHTASRNTSVDDPLELATLRAREALEANGFSIADVVVATGFRDIEAGRVVTVRVSLPYDALVGIVPTPKRLAAETTMLLEDQP